MIKSVSIDQEITLKGVPFWLNANVNVICREEESTSGDYYNRHTEIELHVQAAEVINMTLFQSTGNGEFEQECNDPALGGMAQLEAERLATEEVEDD